MDINAKGQVIIETAVCGVSGGPGSLWENGVLYDLNELIPADSGFYISDPNFINDRGEIGVTGVLPNGDEHVLLLIPVDKNSDSADDEAGKTPVVTRINPLQRLMGPSNPRFAHGYSSMPHTTSRNR